MRALPRGISQKLIYELRSADELLFIFGSASPSAARRTATAAAAVAAAVAASGSARSARFPPPAVSPRRNSPPFDDRFSYFHRVCSRDPARAPRYYYFTLIPILAKAQSLQGDARGSPAQFFRNFRNYA